ncbi:NADH-cytochrome b5 reductase 1 [Schistosoma japonicum]|uniref:NADH-cytochrome b5 reductase 1 n=1 Tax=Schistosoma japonicum TaxID=6182 RepID=A0A4Z2DQ95_SCHJA|nr:NADH-cytochrome b5 reductase 1 [Schistosoma japonicum]
MAQNTTIAVVASVTAVVAVSGVVLGLIFRSKKPKKTLVDNDTKIPLRVVDRSFITHDTIRLKLGLPTADHILGLPVGNHVFFSAKINGSLVVRPYTPITLDNQKGYVDFVIKVSLCISVTSFVLGLELFSLDYMGSSLITTIYYTTILRPATM